MLREELILFLDSVREYMHESANNIGYDERDSSEFVDIYLERNPTYFLLNLLPSNDEIHKQAFDKQTENAEICNGILEFNIIDYKDGAKWVCDYIKNKLNHNDKSLTPRDAANALNVVVNYLIDIAEWKEHEGFVEAPKAERLKALELLDLKNQILRE